MEAIKRYKYKSSVGAYCLTISINGEPNLVNKLIEIIDKSEIDENIKEI